MSQVFDIDTINYPHDWQEFIGFHITNTFYLLAPEYYYTFYAMYLSKCINIYDGWLAGMHKADSGFIPQKMLQSISKGLNDMLFAGGVDFSCESEEDYTFITEWAKKHRGSFFRAIKKARLEAFAGGTSILKLNRRGGDLYCTAHRMDTWFADTTADGEIVSIKVYNDVIDNFNKGKNSATHYGICEERYFNDEGIPCVKTSVYASKGTLQTSVLDRPTEYAKNSIKWENLPREVRQRISKDYPSVMIGEEQYLPFKDSLGVVFIKNTENIPSIPTLPFGQPIGDILMTESIQYDQLKYFEREEVHLARARALIPEEFWNKDDPANDRTLDERFYQQVSSSGDQITPLQFQLRAEQIRVMRENILKDTAFKMNVSASTIASFLDDGTGSMTATQIINEKTKTDTWIKANIKLIEPEINEILRLVMNYYGKSKCEVIIKAEGQSPFLDKLKAFSDVYSAGNMTAKNFVNNVYSNLSQREREEEIRWLEDKAQRDIEMHNASINAWQPQQ